MVDGEKIRKAKEEEGSTKIKSPHSIRIDWRIYANFFAPMMEPDSF
jgi:hypothetical protein